MCVLWHKAKESWGASFQSWAFASWGKKETDVRFLKLFNFGGEKPEGRQAREGARVFVSLFRLCFWQSPCLLCDPRSHRQALHRGSQLLLDRPSLAPASSRWLSTWAPGTLWPPSAGRAIAKASVTLLSLLQVFSPCTTCLVSSLC